MKRRTLAGLGAGIAVAVSVLIVPPVQAATGHPTDRKCSAWHNTSTSDGVVQTQVCIVLRWDTDHAVTRIDVVSEQYYGPNTFSDSAVMSEKSVTEAGDVSHTSFGSTSGSTTNGWLALSKEKNLPSHYRMYGTAKVTLKEGGPQLDVHADQPRGPRPLLHHRAPRPPRPGLRRPAGRPATTDRAPASVTLRPATRCRR